MNPALLMPSLTLKTGDALLVIDVHHDCMPGGALGIQGADLILPPLNRVIVLANPFLRQPLNMKRQAWFSHRRGEGGCPP